MHITIGLVFEFQHNLSDRKEEPLERKSDIRIIQDNRFGRIDGSKLDYSERNQFALRSSEESAPASPPPSGAADGATR